MKFEQWKDFKKGDWESEINVRDFIQKNNLLVILKILYLNS